MGCVRCLAADGSLKWAFRTSWESGLRLDVERRRGYCSGRPPGGALLAAARSASLGGPLGSWPVDGRRFKAPRAERGGQVLRFQELGSWERTERMEAERLHSWPKSSLLRRGRPQRALRPEAIGESRRHRLELESRC